MEKVMIGSLVCNRKDLAIKHFESIREFAGPRKHYQHFVLDNGSWDGLREWLEEHEHLFDAVHYMDYNTGCIHGSNFLRYMWKKNHPDIPYIGLEGDAVIAGQQNFVDCVLVVCNYLYEHYDDQWMLFSGDWWKNDHPKTWAELKPESFRIGSNINPIGTVSGQALVYPPWFHDRYGYVSEATYNGDTLFHAHHEIHGARMFLSQAIIHWYRDARDDDKVWERVRNHGIALHTRQSSRWGGSPVREEFFKLHQKGNIYCPSIWDPESLKRYNPVLCGQTYSSRSQVILNSFKENFETTESNRRKEGGQI